MQTVWRIFIIILVYVASSFILASSIAPLATAQEPPPTLGDDIEIIFNQLSPVERVGQLFVVTYDEIGEDTSYITSLIRDYRVGGVWLRSNNLHVDFAEPTTTADVKTVINQLQELTYSSPQTIDFTTSVPKILTETIVLSPTITTSIAISPTTIHQIQFTPIPLFIAIDHEGNGYPYTTLAKQLTGVPGGMALGATWNPTYSEQVGFVVGEELATIGVNMMFGPVLDVLDKPRSDFAGSIGVRSFGGDPYWVEQMTQRYIRGVHVGSQGQVLTIAKHFPGAGGIDRELNQDVPTIQKVLEQLKQIELVPFYAVTAINDTPPESITEGLMTAHIRYRGIQRSIRELTQPISLDAQKLPFLLSSKEIAPWRERGGLIVSGPLGAPAVLKTYQVNGTDFPAKQITLDAFLAGNDLLLLSNFAIEDDEASQFNHITTAIRFFQDKYQNDTTFRQKVDVSVKRILSLKLRLYNRFGRDSVFKPTINPDESTPGDNNLTTIIESAATLIYPSSSELDDRIPSAPRRDENILIFTDDRQIKLCISCDDVYLLNPESLRKAILNRYGPEASDQISPDGIRSMTFTELSDSLANNEQTDLQNLLVQEAIGNANWIIFAMLNVDEVNYPSSTAVKQFLREGNFDLRDKKVIVFSFDAPYYLDNTEVSILTAYYGLYNKTETYIETAVRLLFKEFQAQGYSPVSIDGIEYRLFSILEPDPDQIITLELFKQNDDPSEPDIPVVTHDSPKGDGAPQPIELDIKVGDNLIVRTGVIVDHNGNPVPDDTLVLFNISYTTEALELAPVMGLTMDGIAQAHISIEREGALSIMARSGEATESDRIMLEGPSIIVETPTPTQTAISTETFTPTPTETQTPTSVPTLAPTFIFTPTPTPTPEIEVNLPPVISFMDLGFSIFVLTILSIIIFRTGSSEGIPLESRLSHVLIGFAFGLVSYVLYGFFAVQLVEVERFGQYIRTNTILHWLTPTVTILSALFGIGIVRTGRELRKRFQKSNDKDVENNNKM